LPARSVVRLDFARRVQRAYPADFWANTWLGYDLNTNGKPREAIPYYTAALALQPRSPGAYVARALAFQGSQDPAQALADINQAIKLEPRYATAWKIKGRLLQEMKGTDNGEAALRKALVLNPRDRSARSQLIALLKKAGRHRDAEAVVMNAVVDDPGDMWARRTLAVLARDRGVALLAQGKRDEADAAFKIVLGSHPDKVTAHFDIASALARAKQWDHSARVYDEALQQCGAPLWPGPWYEAIRSEEVFTRLTALRPDDHLPWIMRARLHALQRDWKRAAADYSRLNDALVKGGDAEFLRRHFDDLTAYACVLLLLGDRAGHEQFCKKWVDRFGRERVWWYSLARAGAVSPRSVVPSRQMVEWASAIVRSDRAPWCLHALSLAHYRNDEFDLAIKCARESNAKDWRGGGKALNWLVLAMAHSRLGHAAEAHAALKQARELGGRASPQHPPGTRWPDMAPPDVLAFELLRREAEELIEPKSTDKSDRQGD
jgi:tetratricopeptide (TPR) repeat protein